jgi:hypothetical protein
MDRFKNTGLTMNRTKNQGLSHELNQNKGLNWNKIKVEKLTHIIENFAEK